MSGVNLNVAAWSGHTHQNIALGLVGGLQSVFAIHVYIAFDQFGDTSPALPLTSTAWNSHAVHFRDFEQSLAGGHTAHLAGTHELDRALQWGCGVH